VDRAVLDQQVDRIIEASEILRMKGTSNPTLDDLTDLAEELQDVAEIITEEYL